MPRNPADVEAKEFLASFRNSLFLAIQINDVFKFLPGEQRQAFLHEVTGKVRELDPELFLIFPCSSQPCLSPSKGEQGSVVSTLWIVGTARRLCVLPSWRQAIASSPDSICSATHIRCSYFGSDNTSGSVPSATKNPDSRLMDAEWQGNQQRSQTGRLPLGWLYTYPQARQR
jgi:hypothetical protein